jgi:hypothetical protein
MTSGPCQAPLAALFLLEKAPTFGLHPAESPGVVRRLWREHQLYTSILPHDLKTRGFNLFYDMCHRVPVYWMRFAKDYVDWAAIDAVMGA